MTRVRFLAAVAGVAMALTSSAGMAGAQTYLVLYDFGGSVQDGASPYGSLISSGSTLYGMTVYGGGSGNGGIGWGTLFAFDTSDRTLTTLHSFAGGPTDGGQPFGTLARSGGILYGMSEVGAWQYWGSLFAYDTDANVMIIQSAFGAGAQDGRLPRGSPTLSGNLLYGMTWSGGAANDGIVYAYDTRTYERTLLHTFTGSPGDGSNPYGSLIQSGGNLYGLTYLGGSGYQGALFGLSTESNTVTILHAFTGGAADGAYPYGSLVPSGGKLYGMTSQGGSDGNGTIFAFDLDSNTQTVLHSFTGGDSDGRRPWGSLIVSGDVLYGMTTWGGGSDNGTVFAFDLTDNTFTVLHSFEGGPGDGSRPYGDLLLAGDTLYGLTSMGGANGDGVLFSLAIPEPATLVLLVVGGAALARRRARRESPGARHTPCASR